MRHNYLAIIVMIVVSMLVGFIWYGFIFGHVWSMEGFGRSMEEMQKEPMSAMPYVINIIGVICTCIFCSWLVQKLNYNTFGEGAMLGIYLSIGIIIPIIALHYAFLQKSTTLTAIDAGMSAVVTILICGVLAAWRRK